MFNRRYKKESLVLSTSNSVEDYRDITPDIYNTQEITARQRTVVKNQGFTTTANSRAGTICLDNNERINIKTTDSSVWNNLGE